VNYLRFPDLEDRDIVRNWTTLGRLIKEQGFPPGIRIGAQARAWREDEVEAWLESRRIAPPSGSTVGKDTAVRTVVNVREQQGERGRTQPERHRAYVKATAVRIATPAARVNAVRPSPSSPRGRRAEPRGKPDRPRSQLEAANK
jgi:Prophage CP4-57 regulatory protein (AlpA)